MAVVVSNPSSKKSKKKWIVISLFSIVGVIGVIIIGGILLLVGGITFLSNECDKASAKTKQQDTAIQATFQNLSIGEGKPSITSYSNADCVDGNQVDVMATYPLTGTVTEARTKALQALGINVTDTFPRVTQTNASSGEAVDLGHYTAKDGKVFDLKYELRDDSLIYSDTDLPAQLVKAVTLEYNQSSL